MSLCKIEKPKKKKKNPKNSQTYVHDLLWKNNGKINQMNQNVKIEQMNFVIFVWNETNSALSTWLMNGTE